MTEFSKEKIARVINLSADIAERDAKEANSLVFMARPFVQTTLPHRDPGEVHEWRRKNGNLTLSIRPGWDEDPKTGEGKPIGIPYGSIPRLLLFWMTTEALQTGNKTLKLGNSLADFMREIGLDHKQGGKRSPLVSLKTQMMRLFRSTISIDESIRAERGMQKSWLDMQVVFQGSMSWFDTNDYRFNATNTDLTSLIDGSWVEITDIFYQSITHSAVPLDKQIIQEIKQSPLALDLYAWMTHRTFSGKSIAESSRLKPSFVSWKQLHDQFGANYADIKDFKKKAKPFLRLVQALSSNLCIEEAYGGLNISQKLTRVK